MLELEGEDSIAWEALKAMRSGFLVAQSVPPNTLPCTGT